MGPAQTARAGVHRRHELRSTARAEHLAREVQRGRLIALLHEGVDLADHAAERLGRLLAHRPAPEGIRIERNDDGSFEVLVKGEDGLPAARKVKLGEEGDEGVEVLEGLAEGEAVYQDTTPDDNSSTGGGLFNFRVRMTGGR